MSGIALVDVAKAFGPVMAVDGVSLAVEEGEFLTILGPSGSGKSTLLNLIAGLARPSRGQIVIGGRDVTNLPAAERNVGLVFQSYALFPNMTVAGNVAFPLEVRGTPGEEVARRVANALALVRLSGLEARKPSQISGGQQQRVALARALVFHPDILLLDEPLAALDRKLREEVRAELRRLQRTLGVTTVLVTHDQEEALSLSDRVVVLESGRVRQVGTPTEAYQKPQSRFVADFLGLANMFEGTVAIGEGGLVLRLDDRFAISLPHGATPGSRALAIIRPERVRLDAAGAGGFAGQVNDAVFLGQSVRYHVGLDGGREVIAVHPDGAARHAPGSAVSVHWQASDVWVIPGPD